MEINGGWTRERIELVKRSVCPKGISDDEFALFLEQCKKSGLDPLLKEAFCVARRQNIGNRERPNWVTKHEFQPSETGFLARAERFKDYRGVQASAVYAEDDVMVDAGKGEVVHRFNPAKRKGSLVGAWARVVRDGKLPVVVWLDFSGYVQQNPMWAKIPTTMIEKCARVAALRKAYPEAFGGLYVREELPPEAAGEVVTAESSDVVTSAVQAPATMPEKTATREALEVAAAGLSAPRGEMAEVVAMAAKVVEPNVTPSGPECPSGERRAPAEAASSDAKQAPAEPGKTVVAFGPYKGKTLGELADAELGETIDLAEEKLQEQPKARWAPAMRANLEAMHSEAGRRAATARATHGPGAEG